MCDPNTHPKQSKYEIFNLVSDKAVLILMCRMSDITYESFVLFVTNRVPLAPVCAHTGVNSPVNLRYSEEN